MYAPTYVITVQYSFYFVWCRLVMTGSAKALVTSSQTPSHSCFRRKFLSWTWTNWQQQVCHLIISTTQTFAGAVYWIILWKLTFILNAVINIVFYYFWDRTLWHCKMSLKWHFYLQHFKIDNFTLHCIGCVFCFVKVLLASNVSLRMWTRMRTSWRKPVTSW